MLNQVTSKLRSEHTSCYCACGNDVVVSHTYVYTDTHDFIHYGCPCGRETIWDFSFPTPMLIDNDLYKQVTMPAKLRFEAAGWAFMPYEDSNIFAFVKSPEYVIFDLNTKEFYTRSGVPISMETLNLINYQCKELGWT